MTETRELTYKVKETYQDRIIKGLAVPFNEVTENYGYRERFSPEAFANAEPVQVFFNHDSTSTPIGKVQSYETTLDGLEVVAKLATTEKANEVYTLLQEGVLDSFSIGVRPIESFDEDGVTVWSKAELTEISVVNRPAFKKARISEVHAEQETTEEITNERNEHEVEFNELNERVEILEREFATANTERPTLEVVGSNIKSYGEYVKKVAAGDKEATDLLYAFTGGTTADAVLKNTWVGEFVNIIDNGRPVWNVFSKGAWVNENNNIEWAKIDSDSIVVGRQENEGDDLAKGKLTFTTESAPKQLFGGYAEMSVQEIQRATVNVVQRTYEALAARYAAVTEAQVVNRVMGVAATDALPVDADEWIDAVVMEGLQMRSNKGYGPDALIVSADVYGALAKLSVKDDYMLDRTTGSLNLGNYTGSVFNLPVVISNTTATGLAAVVSKEAIRTFESPGHRLQDTNVVNLTGAFSLYGEIAIAEQDLGLIKRFGA